MKYCVLTVLITAGLGYSLWHYLAYEKSCNGDFSKIKSPLLIFDFDGTLCPSYYLFIAQLNSLSEEYALKKIHDNEIESLRDMSAKNIMKKLGVSTFKLPFLIKKLRQNVQQQLLQLEPVSGTVDVLKELKLKGISLGILTSNSEENVRLYLEKYGIDCFDFIYSGNSIFGKDGHLKSILKKAGLNENQVIYIGDEVRDIEAAQKIKIKGAAVTWGYHSANMLETSHPSFICKEPNELLKLVDLCSKY